MTAEIRIVSANLDYTRDGDRRYLTYLRTTYAPAVACLQEVERGLKGTRVRGWGVKVGSPRRVVFGRKGAHRAIAWRWAWIDGVRVRVVSVHGLHAGTVGRAIQTAHLMMIVAWLLAMREPWIIAGDFNRRPAAVARKLKAGGFVAHRVDGVIVSRGLEILWGHVVDDWGVRNKVTDHEALVVTVALAGIR